MATITLIIASVTLIMSIVIAIGKGDGLIAGYNTASKEEKAKVTSEGLSFGQIFSQKSIKRLRLLTSIFLLLVSAFVMVLPYTTQMQQNIMIAGFFPILFIFLILANTWCKKK